MSTVRKDYPVSRNLPVWKFYYQGHHSHPVRRTILVHRVTQDKVYGYELREGTVTRSFKDAPMKSFKKSRIAKIRQCGRRLRRRTDPDFHDNTTLQKFSLLDFVKTGV